MLSARERRRHQAVLPRLSRTVYLVLYLIIGAQQIVNIVGALQDEGGPAQDLGMLKPTSQAFCAIGLIALVLIRVLAYLTWRRYRFIRGPDTVLRPFSAARAPDFEPRRSDLNSPR